MPPTLGGGKGMSKRMKRSMGKWMKKRFQYPSDDELRETVRKYRKSKKPPPQKTQLELQTAIWGRAIPSYLSHPITKKSFLSLLQERADIFEVAKSLLPIQLKEDAVYDLGSTHTNAAKIMAFLDLTDNEDLVQFLKQNTDITDYDDPQKVSAAFISEQWFPAFLRRVQSKPLLRLRNHVFMTIHDLDQRNYSYGTITSRGYDTVADGHFTIPEDPFDVIKMKKLGQTLDKLFTPISSRFLGFYDKVLAWSDGSWRYLWLKEQDHRIKRWKGKELEFEFVPITLIEEGDREEANEYSFTGLPEPAFTAKVLDEDAHSPGVVEYQRMDGSKDTAIVGSGSITPAAYVIINGGAPLPEPDPCIYENQFPPAYGDCGCAGYHPSIDACLQCCEDIYNVAKQALEDAYAHCRQTLPWFFWQYCYAAYQAALHFSLLPEYGSCRRQCTIIWEGNTGLPPL